MPNQNSNKTHCPHNHEYTPENTYVSPKGQRICTTCSRERTRRHREANPEKVRESQRKSYAANPEKNRERAGNRRAANPNYQREYLLQKNYGISIQDYDEMLEAQQGRCAICRKHPKKRRLGVDHNHRTGRIRGLLCMRCNLGLGKLNDNHETLTAAEIYLSQEAPKTGLKIDFGLPDGLVVLGMETS